MSVPPSGQDPRTTEPEALAQQLSAVALGFLELRDRLITDMAQASLAIRKTAQEAGSTSQTLARRATDDFRQTLTEAIRDPVRNADAMLQDGVRRANQSAERLERSMHTIRLASTANAWKTFVACTVASLTVIGGAAFAAIRAHQDIAVSAWVEQINTAVNAGRLARCPDGTGICALVKGSWVSLDR